MIMGSNRIVVIYLSGGNESFTVDDIGHPSTFRCKIVLTRYHSFVSNYTDNVALFIIVTSNTQRYQIEMEGYIVMLGYISSQSDVSYSAFIRTHFLLYM